VICASRRRSSLKRRLPLGWTSAVGTWNKLGKLNLWGCIWQLRVDHSKSPKCTPAESISAVQIARAQYSPPWRCTDGNNSI
jgi:hypothetical protein